MSGISQNNKVSKKPKRRIGLWIVIGLLLVIGINGGIKGMQRGSQAAQSKAARTYFMNDCTANDSESFCACAYDTLGEQAMLAAYDYYKAHNNTYPDNFKAASADCSKQHPAIME